MRISYYTEKRNLDTSVGYGSAGFQVVRALQNLGHEVPFDDPTAPVQISFCNPVNAKAHPGQYQIIYTPWESTSLPHGWLEAFEGADEVWATSDWVADVYRKAGVTTPVYVYEHGISDTWKCPEKRVRGERLNFLHIGEPAPRKGGQMAFDAFREAFGDQTDVHLTMKAHHQNYVHTWIDGDIGNISDLPNITLKDQHFFENEMIDLVKSHDILIYPSYGEGFGLIPLQALATGMPVVSTHHWSPYPQYIIPLDSTTFQSPWFFHPGKMYTPNFEHLVSIYKDLYKNAEEEFDKSFGLAKGVGYDFDWEKQTEKAFRHILKHFTEN